MPDENVAWVRITVYISIHKDHLTVKKSKLVSNLGDVTIPKVRENKSLFYMPNSILCIKLKNATLVNKLYKDLSTVACIVECRLWYRRAVNKIGIKNSKYSLSPQS